MLRVWISKDKIDDLKALYEQNKLGDYSVKTMVAKAGGRLMIDHTMPWDLRSRAHAAILAIEDPFDILADIPNIPRDMVEKVTLRELAYGTSKDNPPDGIYAYKDEVIKVMAHDCSDKGRKIIETVFPDMRLRAKTVFVAPAAHAGLAREISISGTNVWAVKTMFCDFFHCSKGALIAISE